MGYVGGLGVTPRGAPPRIWRFANVVLDERTLELYVGGRLVEIERKQLEMLMFFLQNAGEVIYKNRLAEAVWPGKVVTDSNLTKCVAVLRQAIADHDQSVIKTVHGYGYRLAAPVMIEASLGGPMLAPANEAVAAAR